MSSSLKIADLRKEYTMRKIRVLVFVQTMVILGLLLWLTVEYSNNLFMQQWVAQKFWPAGLLLNGTLVGTVAGLMIGWVAASFNGRRSREQSILDALRKIV